MFGLGIGPVPMDKKSVQVMAAYSYLRMKRERELDAIYKKKVEALKAVSGKQMPHIEEKYAKELRTATQSFDEKELELMRHIAGSLADIIDK